MKYGSKSLGRSFKYNRFIGRGAAALGNHLRLLRLIQLHYQSPLPVDQFLGDSLETQESDY